MRPRIRLAYYGTYIEHRICEAPNLHRPFVLHMANEGPLGAGARSTTFLSGACHPIHS